MKKTLNLLLALFIVSIAQARDISDILSQRVVSKQVYRLKTGLYRAVVLPMSFGEHQLISESDKRTIQKATVLSIDLVYTDFPKGQDLTNLNKLRIQELFRLRKDLITDPSVNWNIIKQVGCENEEEARVLFHGIIVHYKPEQTDESIEIDLSALSELPDSGEELEKKMTKSLPYGIALKDSSVIKVLDRNKKWQNMLVVADLTGSMTPYAMQLMVWFQLRVKENRVDKVVFFNDGDMTPDSEKRIGSTGGIYISKTTKYDEVLSTAKKTIKAGYGGDGPENNCEALIKALDGFTGGEVIMVADNFAPVKDISLLKEIKVPVRIIVCGASAGPIHADYLNLARATGGSVHTMEQDIMDLSKLKEGEEVKIGKRAYRLVKGTFLENKIG